MPPPGTNLLVFLVLVVFFVVLVVFHLVQFKRICGNNFEVGAALQAGDDFAFVEFVFFNVEIGFALWT